MKMLKSLLIKNFILIDEIKLNLTKGFNVLCGETGAGKSIIIKALDSVLGAKLSKDVILDSSRPALIEAVFEDEKGLETVISREIASTSKFRLNGALSSADEVKNLRESLVDIHSQHQTYSYITPKNHIYLLDSYISKVIPEFREVLDNYKQNYFEFKKIEKRIEELKQNSEDNSKEIDFLNFQLKELDDAAVRENEEEELKEELDILSNVQELKEESYKSFYALYGGSESIVEAISKVKYIVSNLASLDKSLADTESAIFDAFENLKDCANFLRDYSSSLELNPVRIEELNERISLIQKLKRKYGSDLDTEREKIETRLKELTTSDNNLEILEEKYETLKNMCEFLANKISEYRAENASALSKLIEEKLKLLELKEAKFEISCQNSKLWELGADCVEFMISTNKNKAIAPMAKVASGGEISRVMLALKSVFALSDKVSTVVFDEIDTGISGIASSAAGAAMVELSKMCQIICVTHQPIICAKADNFIWITKSQGEKTNIKIETLNDEKRLEALAQMASGAITEKSIAFARSLSPERS